MSVWKSSISILSCLVVLAIGSQLIGQENQPVANADAAKAEFDQLYGKWKQYLAELRDLQEKYKIAEENELEGISKSYDAKLAEALAIFPQFRQSALKAYAASPNTNQEVDELLLRMALEDLTKDQYEGAYEIARLLVDNKSKHQGIYSIAIGSAFGLDQFEEVIKLGELGKAAKEQFSQQVYQDLNAAKNLVDLYKKELEIRKKEATADDLPRVKMETSKGTVVIELYENEAPQAVANFISLVESGYYNGLTFHRVLPGFMAQGGCPAGTGSGGPGYNIYCECYRDDYRHHFRGTLSMAHAGKNTGGSQFFLTFKATSHLDGRHTAFGRVIEGLDVLAKLQRIDPSERATAKPDKIVKAEVIRKRNHPYEPTKVK